MVTPLEREVLDDLVEKLRQDSTSEEIITGLMEAFHADRLPTPDVIASLIRDSSGDRVA